MSSPAQERLTTTQILAVRAGDLAKRRIWLPRIVYESLPFAYITVGFAAFFATLYIPEWYWVVPYYFLFACASIHAGLHVWTKRFRARLGRRSPPATRRA